MTGRVHGFFYDPYMLFEEFIERLKKDPHDPELEALEEKLKEQGFALKAAPGYLYGEDALTSEGIPVFGIVLKNEDGEEIADGTIESEAPFNTELTEEDYKFLNMARPANPMPS